MENDCGAGCVHPHPLESVVWEAPTRWELTIHREPSLGKLPEEGVTDADLREAWEYMDREYEYLEQEEARVSQAWTPNAGYRWVGQDRPLPRAATGNLSYEEYRERVEAERVARRRAFMGGE